jgi:hypothetical protein
VLWLATASGRIGVAHGEADIVLAEHMGSE